MPSLYRRRTLFETQLLGALRRLTSGAKWKLSGCALFNQSGDYYQDAFISVRRNDTATDVAIRRQQQVTDTISTQLLRVSTQK